MKPYFKTYINGHEVVKSGSLEECQEVARNTDRPYEIYAYYRSVFSYTCRNLKIHSTEVRRAIQMQDEGRSLSMIAVKYGVSKTWMFEILKKYRNENCSSTKESGDA